MDNEYKHITNYVGKSGYMGVSTYRSKWQVKVYWQKDVISLGYFSDAIEAAKVRDAFVIANDIPQSLNFDYTGEELKWIKCQGVKPLGTQKWLYRAGPIKRTKVVKLDSPKKEKAKNTQISEADTRICTKCTKEKPLTEFEKCPKRKNIWRHTCKKCRSSQRRQNLEHEHRLRIDSLAMKSAYAIWDNAIRQRGAA